jgi:UDP-N-acetyl-D-glucosamine dehydrogenase
MANKYRAAVIGQGYVGLPLALEMVRSGYEVVGIDINSRHIESLRKGRSTIDDVKDDALQSAIATGRIRFETSFEAVNQCNAVCICVPTPLRASRDPDTSYIENALAAALPYLAKGTLVVLESTTYPGTTRDLVATPIAGEGYEVGKDVYVAFSPERVDPANPKFGIRNTPKVVGGITPECTKRAADFYGAVVDQVVVVNSPEEAELVKLFENTFRSVNIALANEFSLLADRMKIDIWSVIQAAATKPFGFMPFYPGPGIGGHCIPLDPVYLGWKAKSYGFYSRFIETASDINANMPRFVLRKLFREANEKGILLNGANVVVGGLSYKPNIRDPRESPALEIVELLEENHAKVTVVDPLVESLEGVKLPKSVKKVSLDEAVASKPDIFVLVTPHSNVPWDKLARASRLVFDTRNAIRSSGKDHPGWIHL